MYKTPEADDQLLNSLNNMTYLEVSDVFLVKGSFEGKVGSVGSDWGLSSWAKNEIN